MIYAEQHVSAVDEFPELADMARVRALREARWRRQAQARLEARGAKRKAPARPRPEPTGPLALYQRLRPRLVEMADTDAAEAYLQRHPLENAVGALLGEAQLCDAISAWFARFAALLREGAGHAPGTPGVTRQRQRSVLRRVK